MKMLPATVTTALLLLFSQTCLANFVEDEWEWMISRDFKKGCITRIKQFLVITGYNGNHSGVWFVESCDGLFEYGSNYYPGEVPPEHKRIEVRRLRELPPLTPKQIEDAYF